MNAFKPKPKLPQLFSLTDVDAQYAETLATRLRLQAERLALIAEAGQLRAEIASGMPTEQSARIASVMDGEPITRGSPTQSRLHEILERIVALDSAIAGLYGRGQSELHQASRKLCDTVRETHDKLVRNLAMKMVEIHTISTEYFGLINALESQGASTASFPQLNLRAISHPHDHDSALGYFLRSVRDGGLVSNDQLPEAIR